MMTEQYFQITVFVVHGWVPLPWEYVYGIDIQKADFERKMYSYFRGEWRNGGWYEYYIYGLFIKEPLGTWFLIGIVTFCGLFLKGYSASWRDEMVLLVPLFGILIFVSFQIGFSHHMRYMLPIFPMVFILISKVLRTSELRRMVIGLLVKSLTCHGGGKRAGTIGVGRGHTHNSSVSVIGICSNITMASVVDVTQSNTLYV